MSAPTIAQREVIELVDRGRWSSAMVAGLVPVSLMSIGADILCSGEWHTIESATAASGSRVHLTTTDGTEWVGDRTAMRRYRPAPAEGEAP